MNAADYIAFDVETATAETSSLCQIGYVGVCRGEIIFRKSHIVQPQHNEYSSWNLCIQGIGALKTKDEPLFSEIWDRVRECFTYKLLVMYNVPFICLDT